MSGFLRVRPKNGHLEILLTQNKNEAQGDFWTYPGLLRPHVDQGNPNFKLTQSGVGPEIPHFFKFQGAVAVWGPHVQ